MTDQLEKQVEDGPNPHLIAMKRRIDMMQVLYFVLFAASLALIVYNRTAASTQNTHVLWAVALGGAVIVRLIRGTMVSRYNTAVSGGRPGPLT